MSNPIVEWAKDNPLVAGGAALAVVIVVLLATSSGSQQESGGDGMGSAGVQAYYAAVANQAQAGAAIQTTQIRANAETNRALIGATYGLEVARVTNDTERQRINAGVQVAELGNQATLQSISSNERLGLATIGANVQINQNQFAVQQLALENEQRDIANRYNIARLASTSRLGRSQRGAVYQAAITGQVVPVTYRPVNPGNSASSIITAVGNAAGQVIPFL